MKLSSLLLSVGALGVLAGGVYFLRSGPTPPPADPRLGQPVLAATDAEKAAGLRFVQDGQTVELRRQASGGWTVPSYYDLPADFSRLSQLTESLASAKWQTRITSNPERLKRLELEKLSIELLNEQGQPYWTLQVGKNFDGGGRFARLGQEPVAFTADLNLWLDAQAKNWADSALLSVKPEDVKTLEVAFAASRLTFSRADAQAAWTSSGAPEGQRPKASQLVSALSSLTGLRFSQTYAPSEEKVAQAAAHGRTFRLETFAGATWTIELRQAPAAPLPTPSPAPAEGATPPPLPPENPVFAVVQSSSPDAPLTAAMAQRAFEVYSYVLSSLPQDQAAWFEPAPAPTPTPPPAAPAP